VINNCAPKFASEISINCLRNLPFALALVNYMHKVTDLRKQNSTGLLLSYKSLSFPLNLMLLFYFPMQLTILIPTSLKAVVGWMINNYPPPPNKSIF